MHEETVFTLVILAALVAFVRAVILSKYRGDMAQDPSQPVIASLMDFKKKRPIAGAVLIVASVLQVCCLTALAIVLLLRLL
ncbi:MAG: hypothetical protein Q8O37_16730 [Sulfuricellaceae bacterium]|nr:hypothetical protein [Sulfuricellaceae bacterium]